MTEQRSAIDVNDECDEFVVLLDERGEPCGQARKTAVHHENTPLHLAFSCWITDQRGRILITRRAWSKRTWPGTWTNAFCGHPSPGEPLSAAVHRRARQELGTVITEPLLTLPEFHYRAVMDNGIVEHEVCPVFVAQLIDDPSPDPDEVAETQWMTLDELRHRIGNDDRWFSPWAVMQLSELAIALPSFGRCPHTTSAREAGHIPGTRYRDFLGHRAPSPSARPSRALDDSEPAATGR